MTEPGFCRLLAPLLVAVLAAPLLLAQAGATPSDARPAADNPFFKAWETPFNTPPFDKIRTEHFLPAIKEGIKRHQAEIDAITANPDAPTFDNTVAALDRAGVFLGEVLSVFGGLQGAETSPELQAAAREAAPVQTAHFTNIRLDRKLFERVKAVYDQREKLKLNPEERFLLENSYQDFVRGGALLDEAGKARLREINKELSLLSVKFGDNLLAETNASRIVIEKREDLAGLPPDAEAMGAETAKTLKMEGKWVYTVQVPSMTPFLQYSANRALREQLYRAYFMRGNRGNDNDNKETVLRIVTLRQEKAKLLGYPSHAHFVLEENMAKTPDAVNAFLKRLWAPALARAKAELGEMQAVADREKAGFRLASWDWWYYAEKLRKEKYDLDDTALRPYFKLENVREGVFRLCRDLYGLQFLELKDVPVYNPEVRVYEVKEEDGRHVGLLYLDFHPRPGKRGGAWSGSFRRSWYRDGRRVPPLSTIVCNFTRPTADAPSLLSLDEVETFFHEFGHALNTLFADSRNRTRNIPRDAVELPSQIMENWALEPELLKHYARHYQTGAVMPKDLMEKVGNSKLFNQGFATVEYLAASFLDLDWHTLPDPKGVEVNAFETKSMDALGLIPEILPRYRTPYFAHVFSGGYSAGYYAYIWAGVLDSDAFEAFVEKGLFDRATARLFRDHVLAKLGTEDTMTLYKRFRVAEPKVEPLLKRRGLLPADGQVAK